MTIVQWETGNLRASTSAIMAGVILCAEGTVVTFFCIVLIGVETFTATGVTSAGFVALIILVTEGLCTRNALPGLAGVYISTGVAIRAGSAVGKLWVIAASIFVARSWSMTLVRRG